MLFFLYANVLELACTHFLHSHPTSLSICSFSLVLLSVPPSLSHSSPPTLTNKSMRLATNKLNPFPVVTSLQFRVVGVSDLTRLITCDVYLLQSLLFTNRSIDELVDDIGGKGENAKN